MKNFGMLMGLGLAIALGPQAAAAQQAEATSNIVVSAEYQREWNRGNQIEADGLKALQKAQNELIRQSAAMVTAQEKRDTSRERALNARVAFENLTARATFTDPASAREWAKQVERSASDWKKFDEASEQGAREFERAERRQSSAQEKVDEAEREVEKGRALMAEAVRASQMVSLR